MSVTEPAAWSVRGTLVSRDAVDFHLADGWGTLGVRLEVDFPIGPTEPDFAKSGDWWHLHLPRPAVDRLEYQLTVRSEDGTSWITDPGNPRTVPNPFGDKSEILFPDYTPPAWLATPAAGSLHTVPTAAGKLGSAIPTTLWAPDSLDPAVSAPLLIANDGSDMAERGSLLRWATLAARTRPFRVAMLDPELGSRHAWYSANPDYADDLAEVVLPAIANQVAVGRTLGLGASLGALSMLHAQRRHPEMLQSLALQSGSFFTARLDPQESDYGFFDQVCTAVASLTAGGRGDGVPVLMTCGAVEENRANNERMADRLLEIGYQVKMHVVPDAHTMIGWRDAWSPGLESLLDGFG